MKKKSIQSKKQERLRGVMKPVKRGIQVKGSWKAVDLDPSLFSEEDMGGLVCFEELTDYRLVDSKVATKQKDKVAKKRKARNVEGDDEGDEEVSGKELESVAKKKKKKKRDKKREKAGTSAEGEDDHLKEDEAQGGHVECEGENNQTPLTVLKKNKKKSKVKKEQEPTVQTADRPVDTEVTPSKVTPPAKKRVKNWAQQITSSLHQDTDLSAWKDLFVPQPVLRALGCLGFSSPTPIQALALPSAIRDHMDILGAAETGSGKTLAFGIPMIHTVLEWKKGQESGNQESGDSHSVQDAEEAEEREAEMDALVDDANDDKNDVDAHIEDTEGDDDDDDEESGSQTMGLVKVIENVKFDFMDKTDEKKALVSQKQPLLGLVLTPTRELAVQVKHHIDAVAQFTGIKTAIIVGGMASQKQNRVLKRWPEIVIATPGRLWELIREGHPHLQNLKQLRSLVIDEADRMVEKGHFAELENLLEMLNSVQFNPGRQTFVFSATLTMVHQLPTRLLQKKKGRKLEECNKLEMLMEKVGIKAKPKVIDLTRKEATAETLTETRIHCDKDEKDFYLYYFLQQYPGRTMVFANSIDCIKRLTSLLTILECTALSLHANMHQKQRLKNLERFAEKDSCVLLTTDVAARGLDIPDVQHVIHYQVPRTSETYVHRSGRTARATKQGLSLLLVSPEDTVNFKKIYRTLGKEEDLPVFPIQTKCMAEIKERVNLARKIEKIEYYNSREKHHDSWFKKAAEAMDLELDDDVLLGKKRAEGEDQQHQKMLKGLKRHLKHLLQQPIFRNMMKTKYPTQMGKLVLPELPLATQRSALESLSAQRQEVEKKVCKKKQLRWRKKKQQQQDD